MANFADSYVGQLRQVWGSRTLLVPSAQVLVLDGVGNMLAQRRTDNGLWEIPGGTADVGHSFRSTAVMEVAEEAGVQVSVDDLVPFASISAPANHILTYGNGDETHAFSIVFAVTVPQSAVHADAADGEAVDHRWVPVGQLPKPVNPVSQLAVDMYLEYQRTGQFQID